MSQFARQTIVLIYWINVYQQHNSSFIAGHRNTQQGEILVRARKDIKDPIRTTRFTKSPL